MQALMNMRLIEADEGRVVFGGTPKEDITIQEGQRTAAFTAAMLDSGMGCAVLTTLAAGIEHTTVEFKWNMVCPMSADSGEVRAEGSIVHRGRTIATAEGRLLDASGKLIAHGCFGPKVLTFAPTIKGGIYVPLWLEGPHSTRTRRPSNHCRNWPNVCIQATASPPR
jgi:uncharacterized protein (TIGR00369 family)